MSGRPNRMLLAGNSEEDHRKSNISRTVMCDCYKTQRHDHHLTLIQMSTRPNIETEN